jgi:hypothetical protein
VELYRKNQSKYFWYDFTARDDRSPRGLHRLQPQCMARRFAPMVNAKDFGFLSANASGRLRDGLTVSIGGVETRLPGDRLRDHLCELSWLSRALKPAHRPADGTLVVEEPTFDPISGRGQTTWYWSGPNGQGHKSASLRLYTVTELIHLLQSSGLKFISAHQGCSEEAFKAEGPEMGGRVGILTERV